MDIAALRALVLDVNAVVYGVAATVTPPGQAAVPARGIWLQPLSEEMPVGRDFQRREPRRVLGFRVSEIAAIPRGSVIAAAEHGGATRSWKVDGVELQTPEQIRVIVVPV